MDFPTVGTVAVSWKKITSFSVGDCLDLVTHSGRKIQGEVMNITNTQKKSRTMSLKNGTRVVFLKRENNTTDVLIQW